MDRPCQAATAANAAAGETGPLSFAGPVPLLADRMTTVAGTRRDAILRRIDERRAALARRLSEAADRAETTQLNTMENAPAVAPR